MQNCFLPKYAQVIATFLVLQRRPLSNILVKGSLDDKYEIMLFSVSSYILKYLLKCLGTILGKITSKKFSIFGITFGSLKNKRPCIFQATHPSQSNLPD